MASRIKVGQLYGCKCEPMEFPMEFFAPHEGQAQRNHWQSLNKLAERGGLALGEAIAILNGNDKRYLDCHENEEWLKKRFARWSAAQGIEAATAGETVKHGSAEGESPVVADDAPVTDLSSPASRED